MSLTQTQLASAVADRAEISRNEAKRVLGALEEIVLDELSGRKDTLFSDDAIELLHRTSRGIPRQINNLATQALIACYAGQKATVDLGCAQAAVAEVSAE